MSNSRRNPFEGVTDFVTELSRLRAVGLPPTEVEIVERTHASAWLPTTDILARGDDVLIRIELAGVDPSDIDLALHHGVLTVSGSRTSTTDDETDAVFYVRERFHGEFRRLIRLPEGTVADDVTAVFADGLVEITVTGAAARDQSTRITLDDRSPARTARRVVPRQD